MCHCGGSDCAKGVCLTWKQLGGVSVLVLWWLLGSRKTVTKYAWVIWAVLHDNDVNPDLAEVSGLVQTHSMIWGTMRSCITLACSLLVRW